MARTPAEAGLTQLPLWRPFQSQTVDKVESLETGKLLVISAPTGSGKSPIALASALLGRDSVFPPTGTVLTNQRSLQAQYEEYVTSPPVVSATGRSNHKCVLEHPGVTEHTTAAQAPCTLGYVCDLAKPTKEEDVESIPCPYFRQRDRAEQAKLRVLNYPYFFHQVKNGRFQTNTLVCDEGHRLDKALLDAQTISFTDKELQYLGSAGCPIPSKPTGTYVSNVPEFEGWVKGALITLGSSHPKSDLDQYQLRNLTNKFESLQWFVRERITAIIVDGKQIVPVLPEELAPHVMLNALKAPSKLVVMSASIFDAGYVGQRLGIPEQDCDFVDIPSSFPVKNRSIYIKPVERLNISTLKDPGVLRALTDSIDNIITKFAGRKGVVHCASFSLGREIYERSKHKDRLVMAESGNNRLGEFLLSEKGVYLSPSAYEGLDLKDDLCRFNIVAKLNWPNRGDPVTMAQMELIPRYSDYETASAFLQAVGRGVRHKDDWCSNFVLDGTFYTLWGKMKEQLPQWVKDAIVWQRKE